MFSEMIQNLLNSGGKQAAMQRTTQINKYVNSMNRQLNPNQSVNNSPLIQFIHLEQIMFNLLKRFYLVQPKQILALYFLIPNQ